jgi:hypothetical protein
VTAARRGPRLRLVPATPAPSRGAPALPRLVARELALWASIYPVYLLIRSGSVADPQEAIAHAWRLIQLEQALGAAREASLQHALAPAADFFAAYYMLGFGPLLAAVLIWLGLRKPVLYRDLRTLLLVSLGAAVVLYVFFPTAPPRLVPGTGLTDTVGLSSHDTGSVAGIRFNPYAAMPSMHVGWSLAVALIGMRAISRRWARALFAVHPLLMAVTVSATGNHYFVDSVAGVGAVLVALAVIAGVRRLRASRRAADPPAPPVELAAVRRRPNADDARRAA